MTKVEIDGKTYCVETLIYTVERLTKDVKASAEHHRLVLDKIRAEIENLNCEYIDYNTGCSAYVSQNDVLQIINNHIKGVN